MEETLGTRLTTLLQGKTGTLLKVELHSHSEVTSGQGETGDLSVIEHVEGPMVFCRSNNGSFLKTSPVQYIRSIDNVDGKTVVLFKTMTSTYEVTVNSA